VGYTWPQLSGFSKYVTDNYFDGKFPIKYWNQFLTIGNRTNNHVEGYNNKLKKWIGAKAPNIFKAIGIFQQAEVDSALKFERAKSTDLKVSRPPPRRHLDIEKEAKLKMAQDLLKKGSITLDVYIDTIVAFYDFFRKPAK
jgi:hypothetical protein